MVHKMPSVNWNVALTPDSCQPIYSPVKGGSVPSIWPNLDAFPVLSDSHSSPRFECSVQFIFHNLAAICPGFGSCLTAPPTQNKEGERGITKESSRNGKFNNYIEKGKFRMQWFDWLQHWTMLSVVPTYCLGGSCGPNPLQVTLWAGRFLNVSCGIC